jgi:hypothetical protein
LFPSLETAAATQPLFQQQYSEPTISVGDFSLYHKLAQASHSSGVEACQLAYKYHAQIAYYAVHLAYSFGVPRRLCTSSRASAGPCGQFPGAISGEGPPKLSTSACRGDRYDLIARQTAYRALILLSSREQKHYGTADL